MTTGTKFDAGKPDWSLLTLKDLEPIIKVLMLGEQKYGRDNWKHVEKQRYFSALLRHIAAWQKGETMDPESGESHLAHAACCLLFMLHFENSKG